MNGLLLSDDLIFISRITGIAKHLGYQVSSVRNMSQLVERSRENKPACILIDLANPGLDLGKLISQLQETLSPMPRLVAYGSHVDASGLRAARELGCDPVLPRSRFVEDLPVELPGWFQGR